MNKDPDRSGRQAAWALRLQGSRPKLPRPAVRQSVLDRVAASALAHAACRIVRLDASPWVEVQEGVRERWLRRDGAESLALIELDDGATLPEVQHAVALEEWLARGSLVDAFSGLKLPIWSHASRPAGTLSTLRSSGPSMLLRRMLHAPAAVSPSAEVLGGRAQFSPQAQCGDLGGWHLPGKWLTPMPGVAVLPLATLPQVASMLVRLDAGAYLAGHRREIDEDCLVLEGDLFLGDRLLRSGDYQQTPAAGPHFGMASDTGVLCFVRGARCNALIGSDC